MQNGIAPPVFFRNSRIVLFFYFALSLCSGFLGVCMVILALTLLFPLHDLNMSRGIGCLSWLGGALAFAGNTRLCWRLGKKMGFCEARLDEQGVAFRLGTAAQPETLTLPWNQIAAIQRRREGNTRYYYVSSREGSAVRLSYANFFRSNTLAKHIAARAGCPIMKS